MPPENTVTLTIDPAMLEAAALEAARETARNIVRERMKIRSNLSKSIETAARQFMREESDSIIREAVRKELVIWLDAREGWVAKMLRRGAFMWRPSNGQ